jgi:hypothetical protein
MCSIGKVRIYANNADDRNTVVISYNDIDLTFKDAYCSEDVHEQLHILALFDYARTLIKNHRLWLANPSCLNEIHTDKKHSVYDFLKAMAMHCADGEIFGDLFPGISYGSFGVLDVSRCPIIREPFKCKLERIPVRTSRVKQTTIYLRVISGKEEITIGWCDDMSICEIVSECFDKSELKSKILKAAEEVLSAELCDTTHHSSKVSHDPCRYPKSKHVFCVIVDSLLLQAYPSEKDRARVRRVIFADRSK